VSVVVSFMNDYNRFTFHSQTNMIVLGQSWWLLGRIEQEMLIITRWTNLICACKICLTGSYASHIISEKCFRLLCVAASCRVPLSLQLQLLLYSVFNSSLRSKQHPHPSIPAVCPNRNHMISIAHTDQSLPHGGQLSLPMKGTSSGDHDQGSGSEILLRSWPGVW
jgi:hypothetical protein